MMSTQTKARHILAREREELAMSYRKDGLDYRRIGKLLGVSDKACRKMVSNILQRTINVTEEKAEEVRAIELERLDRMWEGLWPDAQLGDIAAIRTCLQIQERRTQYLGLDAPKKQTVDIDLRTDIDEQIGRLVERAKSSGQVQVPLGINCTPQPIDAPRRLG